MKTQWTKLLLIGLFSVTFISGCGKKDTASEIKENAQNIHEILGETGGNMDTVALVDYLTEEGAKKVRADEDLKEDMELGEIDVYGGRASVLLMAKEKSVGQLQFIYEGGTWVFIDVDRWEPRDINKD